MPETQRAEDAGISAIKQMHELARIPRGATVWDDKGFSWWINDFRQRVWSEPLAGGDQLGCKICVATDFLGGASADSAKLAEQLTAAGRHNGITALVYDPADRTIRHWTTVAAGAEPGEWMLPLLIGASYAQAAAVRTAHHTVPGLFGAELDQSRPPVGKRSCVHEAVELWPAESRLEGKQPSAWRGSEEFAEAAEMFRSGGIEAAASAGGIAAELAFDALADVSGGWTRGRAASFDMRTEEPHASDGNGLRMRLKLPLSLPKEDAEKLCAALNLLETRDFRTLLAGCWCAEEGAPVFGGFVPNIMYADGIVCTLAEAANARLQWVAGAMRGDDEGRAVAGLIDSALRAPGKAAPIAEQPRKGGMLRGLFGRRAANG
jgi:hypothetical protein